MGFLSKKVYVPFLLILRYYFMFSSRTPPCIQTRAPLWMIYWFIRSMLTRLTSRFYILYIINWIYVIVRNFVKFFLQRNFFFIIICIIIFLPQYYINFFFYFYSSIRVFFIGFHDFFHVIWITLSRWKLVIGRIMAFISLFILHRLFFNLYVGKIEPSLDAHIYK